VFPPDALRYLCDKVGVDMVMLGSDYPFPIGDPAPTKVVLESGLSAADQEKILSGTAANLFGIADG
jgi:aminocarboxymuconate-semialdehyde decarboxylase